MDIHYEPTMFDRIQLTITPNYMFSKKGLDCNFIKDSIIEKRKEKNYKHRTWTNKKGELCYFVNLPKNFLNLPYVSDVKLSALHPFTVTLKFNFNRYLRFYVENSPNFRSKYDKDILLDENNYVYYETWPYWDNDFVSTLKNSIKDKCIEIANIVQKEFLHYSTQSICYETVTVSQIEVNQDIYVGLNCSYDVMEKITYYLVSEKGKDFYARLKGISKDCRIPIPNKKLKPEKMNKNESTSVGFEICKGFFFKIYRKDRDHIRTELTYETPCLIRKFKEKKEGLFPVYSKDGRKSRISKAVIGCKTYKNVNNKDIDRIRRGVMKNAKQFFNFLDFKNEIYIIMSGKSKSYYINQLQPLYEFFNRYEPNFLEILSNVLNENPIYDRRTIEFIRKDKKLRSLFVTEVNNKGNKILLYDPEKAKARQIDLALQRDKNRVLIPARPMWAWEHQKYSNLKKEVVG